MAWFRDSSGELVHGVGGLEVLYENRGWEIVDDDTALAEIAARPETPRVRGPKPLVQVKHQAKARLTPGEKKTVRQAVTDEAPPARGL